MLSFSFSQMCIFVVVDTSKCVNMVLPVSDHATTKYLALSVRGEEMPFHRYGWSFYGQNIIKVLDKFTPSEICLIQTDKPVYKPSQQGM